MRCVGANILSATEGQGGFRMPGLLTAKTRAMRLLAILAASTLLCALALVGCAEEGEPETSDRATISFSSAVNEAPLDDGDSEQVTESAESSEPVEESAESSEPVADIPVLDENDEAVLYALLDEYAAASLIERAKTDEDVAWIATHPYDYGFYGYDAQVKLLTLAATDPLAVPYVRGFFDGFPAYEPDYSAPAQKTSSPSPDIPETGIPHLYQWDERWGYIPFSGFCMGMSACGPTSLTMIYRGLTGDESISPYDMAQNAINWGFVSENGTGSELLYGACSMLGLECWQVPATAEGFVSTLREGYPIIANVGIGYFSTSGHFFVLAGITDDGQIILNDPYSVTRSSQLWDPEFIASETMVAFAYTAA